MSVSNSKTSIRRKQDIQSSKRNEPPRKQKKNRGKSQGIGEILQIAIESPNNGAAIIKEGKIVYANKKYREIFGYHSPKEISGKHISVTVHADDREWVVERNCKRQRGKPVSDKYEFKGIKKDGTTIYIEGVAASIAYRGEKATLAYLRDVTDRKHVEEELKIKSRNLEEANTALKVLLKQRDQDKGDLEEKVLRNVKELVLPYIDKLKGKQLNDEQRRYIDILETNLKNIISPFLQRMTAISLYLTPAEIRVANFIKENKTVKEISKIIGVSESAVNLHRQHIRNKMGLNKKKINLRVYLLSLK